VAKAFSIGVLLRVSLPGGQILVPSNSGAVGDHIRVRILATDVSLAREPPGRSSILNVLPAQIVATNPLNAYEVLAAVALGENGAGDIVVGFGSAVPVGS
jgi:molybdate transport system ATP-binding protein